MGKCKTKAIQTDLGTFKQNQAYPGIILAYSKPCVTLAYLQPWYIQNPDILKIRNIFRTLVYSEIKDLRCQISTMKRFVKIANRK